MKKNLEKFLKRSERGQAIILIAFAFVGLVAMVGLVTDTGILLIEYGKLKRSVDAAAIAAAQEYRPRAGAAELDIDRLENAAIGMLHLNQVQNISNIEIHTCETGDPARPVLCNPDPLGNPMANRKLVEVTASSDVTFGFLRVIGINSVTLTASSIGEAATIDLVLVMDTSASMAYETGSETYDPANGINTNLSGYKPEYGDTDDDPSICNAANNFTCEPMLAVKNVAWDFVSHLYFPYDRVSIVTMTSQHAGGSRDPIEVIPLTSDRDTIRTHILGNGINDPGITVFEPRDCDGTDTDGICLQHDGAGNFAGAPCQIYENSPQITDGTANPSSCPSSNIGGVLQLARQALTGSGNAANMRVDAFWVVVGLFGGPANSTNPSDTYENGFCPQNTWLLSEFQGPWCRDPYPSTRHYDNDPLVNYTNPINFQSMQISLYDAEDYARDMADDLATLVSGNGVTIYTIGLGAQIQNPAKDGHGNIINGEPPPGEYLLQYIAEEAGGASVSHGQYFYASNSTALSGIFERIAQNIATKISQ